MEINGVPLGDVAKRVLRWIFFKDGVKWVKTDEGPKRVIVKRFRSILGIWIVFGFSLFIIEEAIQMITFSTFPLQDIRAYQEIHSRAVAIRTLSTTGKVLNAAVGWTNPPMMIAYGSFWRAADYYADSMDALTETMGSESQEPIAVTGSTSPAAQAGIDYSSITDVVVGPESGFTAPPVVPDAIVVDRADAIKDLVRWNGFFETVVFPCTSTQVREKVSIAESPFGFNIVAFPSAAEAYDAVGNLRGAWVVINGQIKLYHNSPEIIITSPDQILGTSPLKPESPPDSR